jgi:hypothetical protein
MDSNRRGAKEYGLRGCARVQTAVLLITTSFTCAHTHACTCPPQIFISSSSSLKLGSTRSIAMRSCCAYLSFRYFINVFASAEHHRCLHRFLDIGFISILNIHSLEFMRNMQNIWGVSIPGFDIPLNLVFSNRHISCSFRCVG